MAGAGLPAGRRRSPGQGCRPDSRPCSMGCWVATGSSPPLTCCSVPQFPHWRAREGWRSGTCHGRAQGACCSHRTGRVLGWGPCCAEPLSCPTVTAPRATLGLCPGDSTCWCTHRAVHTHVGTRGATGHISLGKHFSPCPRATGLSLRSAPVPRPHPGHHPHHYPAL